MPPAGIPSAVFSAPLRCSAQPWHAAIGLKRTRRRSPAGNRCFKCFSNGLLGRPLFIFRELFPLGRDGVCFRSSCAWFVPGSKARRVAGRAFVFAGVGLCLESLFCSEPCMRCQLQPPPAGLWLLLLDWPDRCAGREGSGGGREGRTESASFF